MVVTEELIRSAIKGILPREIASLLETNLEDAQEVYDTNKDIVVWEIRSRHWSQGKTPDDAEFWDRDDVQADMRELSPLEFYIKYADDYSDWCDDQWCETCSGTGIGQHGDPDTSTCHCCGGSGSCLS